MKVTVLDLLKMVCSHSYEELERFCGLTKGELYERYIPSLLIEKVIWMTDDTEIGKRLAENLKISKSFLSEIF